jgi:hypothetical protein
MLPCHARQVQLCPPGKHSFDILDAHRKAEEESLLFDGQEIRDLRSLIRGCCSKLSNATQLNRMRGVQAALVLTRRFPVQDLLDPELLACATDIVTDEATPEVFRLLKRLTSVRPLPLCPAFENLLEIVCDFLEFHITEGSEAVSKIDIDFFENIIRIITNMALVGPPIMNWLFENGTAQLILNLMEVLECCRSDEIIQSELAQANLTQSYCYELVNENIHTIFTVAGCLAFYEAVFVHKYANTECLQEFDLDPIVGSMFQCLTMGSQLLTNYTLKVITRITSAVGETGAIFADQRFLGVFVSLRNHLKTPMDLRYVMTFARRGTPPKRRNLRLGFHALSVLNNIGNPEVFRQCLELGILDFNLQECEADQELLSVFVLFFKRMIQSGEDIAERCVNDPIFPILIEVCAGASLRARIGMIRVMAFLITGLGVRFLHHLIEIKADFLEELIDGFEQGTEGLKLKIARSLLLIVNEFPEAVDMKNYLADKHDAIFGQVPENPKLQECLNALHPFVAGNEDSVGTAEVV